MKKVLDFCTDMDKVAEDFISHLNIFRNPQNEIVDLEKQLFKWSMECKSQTRFFLIYMYCPRNFISKTFADQNHPRFL